MSLVVPAMIWVDVETTGLDPFKGQLLQVGFMTTDADLKVLAKSQWLFHLDRGSLPLFGDEALKMHTASGLLFECLEVEPNGYSAQLNRYENLGAGMVRWLKYQIDFAPNKPKFPMAGSTVGFDRAWLKVHAPQVEELFHYRNIDVSTLKNLARLWYPNIPEWTGGRKLHRALPDLEDSIAELKFYRENIMASAVQVLDSNQRPFSPDGTALVAQEAMERK